MKVIIVEICEANTLNNLDVENVIESEFTEVAVLTTECLSLCGLCRAVPFALVNHERVFGKTPDECLTKIKAKINEELSLFNA